MNVVDLKDSVIEVLGKSQTAETCVNLIDALLSLPPQEGSFLTLSSLQNLLDSNEIDENLVRAVQFLTSSQFHLLKAHGQFVDNDGTEHTLDDEEFDEVLLNGTIAHPSTGNVLDNARDMVVPFFVLSIPDELERDR